MLDLNNMSKSEEKVLLSYISPEEKFKLVGSFVIENFWDSFIEQHKNSINIFRGIAKNSIQDFIKVYQDVWDYVIEINILDDVFVSRLYEQGKTNNNLSPFELKIALKLLGLSLYSELEKDCLMALNKSILIDLSEDLKKKYQFSEQEFQLLMTPSFDTFFTSYHLDHLEYKICQDENLKKILEDALIDKYHSHDRKLFELRFKSMYFPESINLEANLKMQRELAEKRKIEKTNFIGNREDFIAFEKLLEYDNFLDFKYRYNLQACPEFYLRKILFSECKHRGLFENVEKPLQLEDEDFILGVRDVISKLKVENDSSYLDIEKSIQNFIQRNPYLDRTKYQKSFDF